VGGEVGGADARPPLGQLFLGYARIGLLGFGGVAPWARQVIVEEKRWLDDREYAQLLGLGQVIPGPNTINSAVMIGDRFRGTAGAVVSVLGIVGAPILVLIALVLVYDRIAGLPGVGAAMAAGAAAAAGMVIGTAIKLARRLKPNLAAIAVGLAAFVSVGIFHLPMLLAVLVLGPLSIACVWWQRR
jgi:chromate transporter